MTPFLAGFLGGLSAAALLLAIHKGRSAYRRWRTRRDLRRLVRSTPIDLHTEVPLSALNLSQERRESLDRIWRNVWHELPDPDFFVPGHPSEPPVNPEATIVRVKVDSAPEPEKKADEEPPPSAWDHIRGE